MDEINPSSNIINENQPPPKKQKITNDKNNFIDLTMEKNPNPYDPIEMLKQQEGLQENKMLKDENKNDNNDKDNKINNNKNNNNTNNDNKDKNNKTSLSQNNKVNNDNKQKKKPQQFHQNQNNKNKNDKKRLDALLHLRNRINKEDEHKKLRNNYNNIRNQLNVNKQKVLNNNEEIKELKELIKNKTNDIELLQKNMDKISNIVKEKEIDYKNINLKYNKLLKDHKKLKQINDVNKQTLINTQKKNNDLQIIQNNLTSKLNEKNIENKNLEFELSKSMKKQKSWIQTETDLNQTNKNYKSKIESQKKTIKCQMDIKDDYIKKYYKLLNIYNIFKLNENEINENLRQQQIYFKNLDMSLDTSFRRIDQIDKFGKIKTIKYNKNDNEIQTRIKYWDNTTLNKAQWKTLCQKIITNSNLSEKFFTPKYWNNYSSYVLNGVGYNLLASYNQSEIVKKFHQNINICNIEILSETCEFIQFGLGLMVNIIDYIHIVTKKGQEFMSKEINLETYHGNSYLCGVIITESSLNIFIKEKNQQITLNNELSPYFFFILENCNKINIVFNKSKTENKGNKDEVDAKLILWSYNKNNKNQDVEEIDINNKIINNIFQ